MSAPLHNPTHVQLTAQPSRPGGAAYPVKLTCGCGCGAPLIARSVVVRIEAGKLPYAEIDAEASLDLLVVIRKTGFVLADHDHFAGELLRIEAQKRGESLLECVERLLLNQRTP